MPRKKSVKVEPAPVVITKTYKRRASTNEERIAELNTQIDALSRLIDQRGALLRATEDAVTKRKDMIAKNQKQLAASVARREKLLNPKPTVRDIKAAEKAKIEEFLAKLSASGKSLEDLLSAL